MALLHRAELTPTKLDLLAAWLPTRPWYDGPAQPQPVRIAAARFDDPDGEVGIETLIVRTGDGPVWQIPLTYRGAPLAGAEEHLVGTAEHSVLGKRWVYDATGDPVYLAEVSRVIREGGREAIEEVDAGGERVRREPDLKLSGSGADAPATGEITEHRDGDPAVVRAGAVELVVSRVPLVAVDPADAGVLTGCWPGQETPVALVHLRVA